VGICTKPGCTVNNLCKRCRRDNPATALQNDRDRRERRGGGNRSGGGRSGRARDIALEAGAAMLEVTSGLTGAGLPPTTDQLDGAQQVSHTRQQEAIGDASNQRHRK
jgi:hypothetical protein